MIVVYKYYNEKILFCGKSVEDIPQIIVPKFVFDIDGYRFIKYGFLYLVCSNLVILDTNKIDKDPSFYIHQKV